MDEKESNASSARGALRSPPIGARRAALSPCLEPGALGARRAALPAPPDSRSPTFAHRAPRCATRGYLRALAGAHAFPSPIGERRAERPRPRRAMRDYLRAPGGDLVTSHPSLLTPLTPHSSPSSQPEAWLPPRSAVIKPYMPGWRGRATAQRRDARRARHRGEADRADVGCGMWDGGWSESGGGGRRKKRPCMVADCPQPPRKAPPVGYSTL